MFNTAAAAISVDLDLQFVKAYKLRSQSLSIVYLFISVFWDRSIFCTN